MGVEEQSDPTLASERCIFKLDEMKCSSTSLCSRINTADGELMNGKVSPKTYLRRYGEAIERWKM